jgi:hypothetical protein
VPGATEYTLDELEQRMRVHLKDHYLTLVSILKGVSIAAAVVAISRLAAASGDGESLCVAAIYVATSFLAIVLTYEAILVGTLLLHWRPVMLDVISPFGVGLLEALLFAYIASVSWSGSASQQLTTLADWLIYFSLWALACGVNILVVWRRVGRAGFDGSLATHVRVYRKGLVRGDFVAASLTAVVAVVIWTLIRTGTVSAHVQIYVAPALLLSVIGGIRSQEVARRRLWVATQAEIDLTTKGVRGRAMSQDEAESALRS